MSSSCLRVADWFRCARTVWTNLCVVRLQPLGEAVGYCKPLATLLVINWQISAWAIPSPDLVVNVFANAAQVVGLLTVLTGSAVVAKRKRAKAKGANVTRHRWVTPVLSLLLMLSVGGLVIQWAYYQDQNTQRLQRNLVRSSTEKGKAVGDTSLKTLSLSGQDQHARGVATNVLNQWIDDPSIDVHVVDVRETEETESGQIQNAWHVRYPDLLENPELLIQQLATSSKDERPVNGLAKDGEKISKTLLICYSGNRSSELVDTLSAAGHDVYFLVGGYEKWIAEDRPLALKDSGHVVKRQALRELARYENDDVLLDTHEVEALVQNEQAILVDVRYPEDFAKDGIAGAINLPLRKMKSSEIDQALAQLPQDKQVIVACYDKRSSFYGQILGLKLTRAGYTFAGRYTVPHEYMPVNPTQRAYVASWQAENGGGFLGQLAGLVTKPLGWVLNTAHGLTGSVGLAVLCSAVILRLAFLRWSLANDRDQAVERARHEELCKIKQNPDRLQKMTQLTAWQKKHGIRPVRNLVATVGQLFLFSAFFAAVSRHAKANPEGFAWWSALDQVDPTRSLSWVMAILMGLHIKLGSSKTGFKSWILPVFSAALIAGLTYPLSTAVNLYLVANIALMFIQQRVVSWVVMQRQARLMGKPMSRQAVCRLEDAHRVPGTGNKALRLAEMMAHGLNVPGGFVVTQQAFADGIQDQFEISDATRALLDQAWEKQVKRLGADKVAVRSSGSKEDGADQSFAGVFESVLNVGRDELEQALAQVHASLRSNRAAAYMGLDQQGMSESLGVIDPGAFDAGAAVVQVMVPGLTHAGVLFTEDPCDSGVMVAEYVEGLGEALVSGQKTPQSVRLGRLTGQVLDDDLQQTLPLPFEQLAALGKKIEAIYGHGQDIEWAYGQGQFWILQSRDITVDGLIQMADIKQAAFEQNRRSVLAAVEKSLSDAVVNQYENKVHLSSSSDKCQPENDKLVNQPALMMNELSELLPKPTPMSLSLMQRLWDHDGPTDIACQMLGLPYDVSADSAPMVVSIAGQLMINQPESDKRYCKTPSAMAAFKVSRDADAIAEHYLSEVLPDFTKRMALEEVLDFTKLKRDDLIQLFDQWVKRFMTQTYVDAEQINIVADMSMKQATTMLEKRGFDPSEYLIANEKTVVAEAMAIIQDIASGISTQQDFVEWFGHRSPHDYEIADPRYAESQSLIQMMVDRAQDTLAGLPEATLENDLGHDPQAVLNQLPGRVLKKAVERAQRFQVLKEQAKHHALREWAQLRRLLLTIDQSLSLEGGIFYLTVDEVVALTQADQLSSLTEQIKQRQQVHKLWESIALPCELTVGDLERLQSNGEIDGSVTNQVIEQEVDSSGSITKRLAGMSVSGVRAVCGLARVITKPEEIDTVKAGEILVTRFTDPTWTPLFRKINGVVTEVGGRLSHAAIVAREYGLSAVVGVSGATGKIQTGDLLKLKPDGSVYIFPDRRSGKRKLLNQTVGLKCGETEFEAIIEDLNGHGALLNSSESLEIGQILTLSKKELIDGSLRQTAVRVTRKQAEGRYAVLLEHGTVGSQI